VNKAYIYDGLTACVLLAIVEAYFWSQGRTFGLAGTSTKLLLAAAYLAVAIGSQVGISIALSSGPQVALKTNALVAILLGVGITFLGFTVHPGIFKDIPLHLTSVLVSVLKVAMTVGLATLLLRVLVAGITLRLAQR
jgi:hypothetical protein